MLFALSAAMHLDWYGVFRANVSHLSVPVWTVAGPACRPQWPGSLRVPPCGRERPVLLQCGSSLLRVVPDASRLDLLDVGLRPDLLTNGGQPTGPPGPNPLNRQLTSRERETRESRTGDSRVHARVSRSGLASLPFRCGVLAVQAVCSGCQGFSHGDVGQPSAPARSPMPASRLSRVSDSDSANCWS